MWEVKKKGFGMLVSFWLTFSVVLLYDLLSTIARYCRSLKQSRNLCRRSCNGSKYELRTVVMNDDIGHPLI